jgi:hypothetical protein
MLPSSSTLASITTSWLLVVRIRLNYLSRIKCEGKCKIILEKAAATIAFSLWLGCVCFCVRTDKNKAEENYVILLYV